MSGGPGRPWAEEVLQTSACRLLDIQHPIVQAGMGYLARQELAAAVSNAGALGVIGSTGNLSPDELDREIQEVSRRTDRPFAVNLLFPTTADGALADDVRLKVDVTLARGVPVLGAGLGVPPDDVIRACRRAGTIVMCTIGAVRHAEKALAAGVDMLVAQGWEAGGHNSGVATMALVPQVAAIANVPVLAAGGIATGAGLVAALALGASGAYLGTAFAASIEARAHDRYKSALVAARDTDTVVTRAYSGKPARVIRNRFTDEHEGQPLLPFPQQLERNEWRAEAVRLHGRLDDGPIPAGQIAGALTEVESAAGIVRRIVEEAIDTLMTQLRAR